MEMDSDAGFQVVGRPDGTGVFSIQLYPGDDVNIMRQLITDDYQTFKKHIETYTKLKLLREKLAQALALKLSYGRERGPGDGNLDLLKQATGPYLLGETGSPDSIIARLRQEIAALEGGRKKKTRKGKKASKKTRKVSRRRS